MTNDVLRALVDSMLESSRLLGIREARKALGEFTSYDARFVRAMHDSIAADMRKLKAALAGPLAQGWRGIESAPKTQQEIAALYPNTFGYTVLIGRADVPYKSGGVLSGCVAECSLSDEGKWVAPTPPELRLMMGGDGWTEIIGPTHWMPLPAPPTAAKENEHGTK